MNPESRASVVLPSEDLVSDMEFLYELGFRLDQIYPADDPTVAVLSGYGIVIRLDKNADAPPGLIYLHIDEATHIPSPEKEYVAPNGTVFKILPDPYLLHTPETRHKFEIRQLRDEEPWVIGRAGMLYRDLIPDRLGGSIIASHIRIPQGGPVPDMVHYHTIGFQLIYCYKGWVKLVYEDQGPPFILKAGDAVTQPPEIRHQVLEASDNLEVIEIGIPAEHMTTIDHDMTLPTTSFRPDREFNGQKFCHHLHENAEWQKWRLVGFEYLDTGVIESTKGMASVNVIKVGSSSPNYPIIWHDADILFTFVMKGQMVLTTDESGKNLLTEGDAFVIPPFHNYRLQDPSTNLELLEVALPGNYKTTFSER